MNQPAPQPPRWVMRFVQWFCPAQLEEGIMGDLLEQYEINRSRRSRFRSNWLFTYNSFRFLRYSILKRKHYTQRSNSIAMFKNYFITSVRSLLKQKFYFGLNVLGLSIGIAACLLCYLHIDYELSYDQYNSKADRIHRLITGDLKAGKGWVMVSAPMPPTLQQNIPEIEAYARLTNITKDPQITVAYERTTFSEKQFYLADPAILEMFDLPLIRGEKSQVLADMNSVILSESSAEKYFGLDDPIGKTLRVDDQHDFQVTGVFADVPFNSHFDFDFLISFQNLERVISNGNLNSWGQFNYFAYLQLAEGADPANVQAKIQETEINLGENRNMDLSRIGIQPLSEIHFVDNRGNIKPAYNAKYIYIYGAIALAILFISFINFVNLSIAASTKRIKEVGVRKVVGAGRGQLILQFIAESFLIALFAVVVALVLSQYLLIPAVNELMNSRVVIDFSDPLMLTVLLGMLGIIAIGSGSYIAWFIFSSQPISALKGTYKAGNKGKVFKNILLGLQFCISTVLILSSLFIYQQLQYLGEKDLGMSKDQIVNVSLSNKTAQDKADVIAGAFRQVSGVRNVAQSNFIPGGANWNQTVWWEGQEEGLSMFLIMVDPHFIETVDMELVEGDIDRIRSAEGSQLILNEAAVKRIGWDNALGKPFSVSGGQSSALPVAGVVKDYNFRSLHHAVDPCVLVVRPKAAHSQLAVRVAGGEMRQVLSQMQDAYQQVLPEMQFEYSFMDESFAILYDAEMRTSKIVGALTVVAIVLAVLGLYALLTFAVQERTRELAIRKVLGIKLKQTLFLLSGNYVRLLIVANLVAIPLTWYMLDGWLNNFNYRISLGVATFAVTILLTFLLIYGIAALKTMQSTRINPTRALRHD